MLGGKLKRGIFEEVVEEEEELPHDGGQREFGGLAGGAQAQVKGAEDGVGAGGAERGHVEGATQAEASAGDVALALECAAVVVERGHAQERRSLAARERAQLRAEGQGGGGGQRAHAPDLGESRRLGREPLLCGEGFGDR